MKKNSIKRTISSSLW